MNLNGIQTRSIAIEMFQTLVEEDLVRLGDRVEKAPNFSKDNLTKAQRVAIKTPKSHNDVFIRQADKGG